MLFNSYEFLFYFLPAVLLLYFVAGTYSRPTAAAWLTAASIFFYGWWNPKFVTLMLASIGFNFVLGYKICELARLGRPDRASIWLLRIGVASNLALLAYYKYANFFISTVNHLTSFSLQNIDVVLPLGISFFTFTQIAFLVDAYRGKAKEYNPVHYALFVTYFPHLIAGPVLNHQQMMPQFQAKATYKPSSTLLILGTTLLCIGLAKKVLLADTFSQYVSPGFDAASEGKNLEFTEAWIASVAYALQLYFDFSGYSDMAVGISMMFGIRLPINFNSPYRAPNIIEFWRRWHITLSHFLRDYLYIALGGNRRGPFLRYVNLWVTMLLGGLWHGASWTFVIWGALHGFFLIANHGWRALLKAIGRPCIDTQSLPSKVLGVALTFLCVVIAWVFFRADSVDAACRMLTAMTMWQTVKALPFAPTMVLGIGLLIAFFAPNSQKIIVWLETSVSRYLSYLLMASAGAVAALCVLNMTGKSEFLYFQF